jgi:hypothetical protein
MSVLLQATVRMPYVSQLPRDVSENTFSFNVDNSLSDEMDAIIDTRLSNFYNLPMSGISISSRLSSVISRNLATLRLRPTDPTTAAQVGPTRIRSFSIAAQVDSNSLPHEVALCVSFRSGTAAGGLVPLQRRTGRIYLGPLTANSMTAGADPVPAANLLTRVQVGALELADANDGDAAWCVWSRAAGTLSPVDNGWTDNEWDTQRRRGNAATSRNPWTLIA